MRIKDNLHIVYYILQCLTHTKCSIKNNYHFSWSSLILFLMVCDFLYPSQSVDRPKAKNTPSHFTPHHHWYKPTAVCPCWPMIFPYNPTCDCGWSLLTKMPSTKGWGQKLGDETIGSPSACSQDLSLPSERIVHWCVSEGPAGNERHSSWDFEKTLVMRLEAGLKKPTGDVKAPKDYNSWGCCHPKPEETRGGRKWCYQNPVKARVLEEGTPAGVKKPLQPELLSKVGRGQSRNTLSTPPSILPYVAEPNRKIGKGL